MSTLVKELEQAAIVAEATADFMDSDVGGQRPDGARNMRDFAARLRARAERARDFPRVLSGELQNPGVTTTAEMFEWLTGPDIPSTAAPSPETGTAAVPSDGRMGTLSVEYGDGRVESLPNASRPRRKTGTP